MGGTVNTNKSRLYRHYKDKFYKYIGLAKHSETEEELVVYEPLYETSFKTWARPKSMFFETVQIDKMTRPRFAPVLPEVQTFTQITQAQIAVIADLMETIFGEWRADGFHTTFNSKSKFHLLIARIDIQPVAFKLGYEQTGQEFYSWLGGVLPQYRGLGLAGELMRLQHQWCREQGYKKVLTKTQNQFREMLMLNIKNGFEVTGTETSDHGLKILMEKRLNHN